MPKASKASKGGGKAQSKQAAAPATNNVAGMDMKNAPAAVVPDQTAPRPNGMVDIAPEDLNQTVLTSLPVLNPSSVDSLLQQTGSFLEQNAAASSKELVNLKIDQETTQPPTQAIELSSAPVSLIRETTHILDATALDGHGATKPPREPRPTIVAMNEPAKLIGQTEHQQQQSKPSPAMGGMVRSNGDSTSPTFLHRKKFEVTVSTPKGRADRPLFGSMSADFPRKRPQVSSSLASRSTHASSEFNVEEHGASSAEFHKSSRSSSTQRDQEDGESNEKRAQRLGMELNLATPAAWRKKTLTASPSAFIPVPKAWSTLLLDARNKNSGNFDESCDTNSGGRISHEGMTVSSNERKGDTTAAKLVEDMKRQNEELQRTNQRLERENAKLKTFLPVLGEAGSRMLPGSPIRKGEPLYGAKRLEAGYGMGHPESELIMQLETATTDDPQVAQTKTAARQLLSLTTLMKTLKETAYEDRIILASALRNARESNSRLNEANARIAALEAELALLRQGSNTEGSS